MLYYILDSLSFLQFIALLEHSDYRNHEYEVTGTKGVLSRGRMVIIFCMAHAIIILKQIPKFEAAFPLNSYDCHRQTFIL